MSASINQKTDDGKNKYLCTKCILGSKGEQLYKVDPKTNKCVKYDGCQIMTDKGCTQCAYKSGYFAVDVKKEGDSMSQVCKLSTAGANLIVGIMSGIIMVITTLYL